MEMTLSGAFDTCWAARFAGTATTNRQHPQTLHPNRGKHTFPKRPKREHSSSRFHPILVFHKKITQKPYLEGHVALINRLIIRITRVIKAVIGVVNLLTKSD